MDTILESKEKSTEQAVGVVLDLSEPVNLNRGDIAHDIDDIMVKNAVNMLSYLKVTDIKSLREKNTPIEVYSFPKIIHVQNARAIFTVMSLLADSGFDYMGMNLHLHMGMFCSNQLRYSMKIPLKKGILHPIKYFDYLERFMIVYSPFYEHTQSEQRKITVKTVDYMPKTKEFIVPSSKTWYNFSHSVLPVRFSGSVLPARDDLLHIETDIDCDIIISGIILCNPDDRLYVKTPVWSEYGFYPSYLDQ